MEKLLTMELTIDEWIDVIIALDYLSDKILFDKRNEKEYKKLKKIKEKIKEKLSE